MAMPTSIHNGCFRKILRIFWPAKITNKNLYETTDIRTLLRKYRRRWIGHILRKPTDDITILNGAKMDPRREKEGRQAKKQHGGEPLRKN
jgi:hypothetical protein